MDLRLLGSTFQDKGASRLQSLGVGAAAAIHTGYESINPKLWTCEDSLAFHCFPDGAQLAAVADAHFGGSSSEAFCGELGAAFARAPAGPPRERLQQTLLDLEAGYVAGRVSGDCSETTILICLLEGRRVSFVSVGDSMLLHLSSGGVQLLNPLSHHFVGNSPLADQRFVHTGTVETEAGVLLLATDGLEQSASGLAPQDLGPLLLGPEVLEARLARLMARATDVDQGGGRDNLALIAFDL